MFKIPINKLDPVSGFKRHHYNFLLFLPCTHPIVIVRRECFRRLHERPWSTYLLLWVFYVYTLVEAPTSIFANLSIFHVDPQEPTGPQDPTETQRESSSSTTPFPAPLTFVRWSFHIGTKYLIHHPPERTASALMARFPTVPPEYRSSNRTGRGRGKGCARGEMEIPHPSRCSEW